MVIMNYKNIVVIIFITVYSYLILFSMCDVFDIIPDTQAGNEHSKEVNANVCETGSNCLNSESMNTVDGRELEAHRRRQLRQLFMIWLEISRERQI